MFKEKNKADDNTPKVFDFVTSIQEKNPLTAVPAAAYAFELVDGNGAKLDDEWTKRQCETIPIETLDPTSGTYLDHEITSAMSRALAELDKQRNGTKGHISIITDTEERENKVVEDISKAVDEQLTKLEMAKLRTLQILSK